MEHLNPNDNHDGAPIWHGLMHCSLCKGDTLKLMDSEPAVKEKLEKYEALVDKVESTDDSGLWLISQHCRDCETITSSYVSATDLEAYTQALENASKLAQQRSEYIREDIQRAADRLGAMVSSEIPLFVGDIINAPRNPDVSD